MASTTGVFTVTNITLTRALDLSTATTDDAANFVGTMIYDLQEGVYDGIVYAITNADTDRDIDASEFSLSELLNVKATVNADNQGSAIFTLAFLASNYVADYVLDCNETSLDELLNVLGALIFRNSKQYITWPVTLQRGRTVSAPGSGRRTWGSTVDKTRNLILN